MDNKYIKTKIFGKSYKLKKEKYSDNKMILLSEILNDKMIDTAKKLNTINPVDVSILTSLNLLEENIRLKNIYHQERKILEKTLLS